MPCALTRFQYGKKFPEFRSNEDNDEFNSKNEG